MLKEEIKMKRIIRIILIYGIISLILLLITSIPPKLDPEKIDTFMQGEMNTMRKIAEEHFPNMTEAEIEESLKVSEDMLRRQLEYENSFSYRFRRNLHAFCIGLPIAILMGILGGAHRRELHGG